MHCPRENPAGADGGDARPRALPSFTFYPYLAEARELARLLASCDALVHAGDQETFGLVVLEAMACGLPVIGVAAGAVPELLDAECGLLARPRDGASLAEAVEALYQRDLAAMGRAARLRVERLYSWDRVFRHQLLAYERQHAAQRDSAGATERARGRAARALHRAARRGPRDLARLPAAARTGG